MQLFRGNEHLADESCWFQRFGDRPFSAAKNRPQPPWPEGLRARPPRGSKRSLVETISFVYNSFS